MRMRMHRHTRMRTHMRMRIHTNVHRSADQDARGNGQDRKEAPRRSDGEGGAAGLVGRAGRGPTAQAREEGGGHPAGHLHGNQHGRLRHAQDGAWSSTPNPNPSLNPNPNPSAKQEEFKKLFELLDLDITENQKENLFAFCDADCSGEIDEKEFQEGWDMMVEVSS